VGLRTHRAKNGSTGAKTGYARRVRRPAAQSCAVVLSDRSRFRTPCRGTPIEALQAAGPTRRKAHRCPPYCVNREGAGALSMGLLIPRPPTFGGEGGRRPGERCRSPATPPPPSSRGGERGERLSAAQSRTVVLLPAPSQECRDAARGQQRHRGRLGRGLGANHGHGSVIVPHVLEKIRPGKVVEVEAG
jgi:hypothetical protein